VISYALVVVEASESGYGHQVQGTVITVSNSMCNGSCNGNILLVYNGLCTLPVTVD